MHLVDAGGLVDDVVTWYAGAARDLPWRAPGVDAWAVLVCEVMSQQTPVARVVPRWLAWLERWPTPTALADAPAGEAVRMWDRLGYPRRALRLHQAATVVRDQHGGVLPRTSTELLGLPGVGPYTAAATAAFANGERVVVLDVNIRRVLARVTEGVDAPPGAPTRAETARAQALLPDDAARSARWNAAVMELGATVCTARAPRCGTCPVGARCAWAAGEESRASGTDAVETHAPGTRVVRPRTTRPQAWLGTDRFVRGLLLAELRAEHGTVPTETLEAVGDEPAQTRRCLDSLLADGLAVAAPGGYRLPG
ncbi:A/G-specific adenine glycosylase [Aquipuribacter hungaricus]|uniref:Adenine DNA glycosylase n=1 Tax=Aquipuribacter hungaricus TaxID=545624 RepID=A0ABV7WJY2_9MICO